MADELERIPERWRERFEFYSRETQPFAIQMVQLIRELGQAENRHVQFMVEGGPVVMAADYADLQAKLEEKEREYQQKLDSLLADLAQNDNKYLLKADKEIERLRTENAEYRAALEKISAVTPCIGTYEQDAHQRVLAALEYGRKATKHITEKEAEIGDGSERNFRLDAK